VSWSRLRLLYSRSLVTFRVSRRRREMYSGHARLSVCLCLSVPCQHAHILYGVPECNLGNSRSAPSRALFGDFAIGARVALLWQHSANAKRQRVLVVAVRLVATVATDWQQKRRTVSLCSGGYKFLV